MAVISAIRKLLALPLLLAGRLIALISPPSCVGLYKAAWAVSGDAQIAVLALQALHEHFGPETAAAAALAWMDDSPRPDIAAFAGLMALQQDDRDAAADWLARGQQAGRDARGSLELLAFLLATLAGPQAAGPLARELAERRDLPPTLSQLVLTRLMWDDLTAGRCEDARRRALHLLAVQDDRDAACILWALETQRGDRRAAGEYLARAGRVSPELMLYFQIHAGAAVGSEDQARRLLAELQQRSPELAQAARENLDERQAGE